MPARGGTPAPAWPLEVVATRPGLGRRFEAQLDERVIFTRHPSPVVLTRAAWPLLLHLILLGGAFYWRFHGGSATLLQVGAVVLAALAILLLGFWLIRGLLPWLAHSFVLTTKRLIEYSGVWHRTRKQLPLEHIQQVRVERPSFLAALLDFGDVVVLTASEDSDLELAGVRAPRAVADSILDARRGEGGAGASAMVEGLHPRLRTLMEQIGGATSAEAAEGAEPALRGVTKEMLLRAPVRLLSGERVLAVIHRHWYLLLRRLLGPIALLAVGLGGAALVMALAAKSLSLFAVVLVLGSFLPGLLWGVLVYLNYIDDLFILTTERVVDIERRYFVLAEVRREAPYERIQDVHVSVQGIGRVLGFGTLTVETAGRLPNIEMRCVPQAFEIQDLIFARINAKRGEAASAAASRTRTQHSEVVATALNELLVEVPDLRGLSLLAAGERLHAAGLVLVIEAQHEAIGVLPGLVIAQMPGPGTMEVRGNEVRVVLSGRPTLAGSVAPPLWPVAR
jgi:uncharacterized membrane protein YdbT with pleckstrin-like domain